MTEAGGPEIPQQTPRGRLRRPVLAAVAAVVVLSTVAVVVLVLGSGDDAGVEAFCSSLSDQPSLSDVREADLIVFMDPDATDEEIEDVQRLVEREFGADSWTWMDQEESFEEFQELFAADPDAMASIAAEDLPPSFRIAPHEPIDEAPPSVEGADGVFRVVLPYLPTHGTTAELLEVLFVPSGGIDAMPVALRDVASGVGLVAGKIDVASAITGGTSGELRDDLVVVDAALQALIEGQEPDTAVISATERVLEAYDVECGTSA